MITLKYLDASVFLGFHLLTKTNFNPVVLRMCSLDILQLPKPTNVITFKLVNISSLATLNSKSIYFLSNLHRPIIPLPLNHHPLLLIHHLPCSHHSQHLPPHLYPVYPLQLLLTFPSHPLQLPYLLHYLHRNFLLPPLLHYPHSLIPTPLPHSLLPAPLQPNLIPLHLPFLNNTI